MKKKNIMSFSELINTFNRKLTNLIETVEDVFFVTFCCSIQCELLNPQITHVHFNSLKKEFDIGYKNFKSKKKYPNDYHRVRMYKSYLFNGINPIDVLWRIPSIQTKVSTKDVKKIKLDFLYLPINILLFDIFPFINRNTYSTKYDLFTASTEVPSNIRKIYPLFTNVNIIKKDTILHKNIKVLDNVNITSDPDKQKMYNFFDNIKTSKFEFINITCDKDAFEHLKREENMSVTLREGNVLLNIDIGKLNNLKSFEIEFNDNSTTHPNVLLELPRDLKHLVIKNFVFNLQSTTRLPHFTDLQTLHYTYLDISFQDALFSHVNLKNLRCLHSTYLIDDQDTYRSLPNLEKYNCELFEFYQNSDIPWYFRHLKNLKILVVNIYNFNFRRNAQNIEWDFELLKYTKKMVGLKIVIKKMIHPYDNYKKLLKKITKIHDVIKKKRLINLNFFVFHFVRFQFEGKLRKLFGDFKNLRFKKISGQSLKQGLENLEFPLFDNSKVITFREETQVKKVEHDKNGIFLTTPDGNSIKFWYDSLVKYSKMFKDLDEDGTISKDDPMDVPIRPFAVTLKDDLTVIKFRTFIHYYYEHDIEPTSIKFDITTFKESSIYYLLSRWELKYLNINVNELTRLTLLASYLNCESLYKMCCLKMAYYILQRKRQQSNFSWRELLKEFKLEQDFSEEEKQKIVDMYYSG